MKKVYSRSKKAIVTKYKLISSAFGFVYTFETDDAARFIKEHNDCCRDGYVTYSYELF